MREQYKSQYDNRFVQTALNLWHRNLGRLIAISVIILLILGSHAQAAMHVVYFHTDASGSPTAAFNADGEICWTETYAPYGEKLDKEDSFPPTEGCGLLGEDIGYTGHVQDGSGLVYAQQRYYDPAISRFMSTDPVMPSAGDPRFFGRYHYANNNPYRYTDPTGMAIEDPDAGESDWPGDLDWNDDGAGFDWRGHFNKRDAISRVNTPIELALYDAYEFYEDPSFAALAGILGRKLKFITGIFEVTKGAGKKANDVIHVTKDGVALPPGAKHKIPDNYVQNPHRSGNYGEIVDGKYKERLRIDPATPLGQKGPNYSHYHKNGKGKHYSPKEGDPDPGF